MSDIVQSSGKRKRAVARATIKKGAGRIRINSVPLEIYPNESARMKILEPLMIAGEEIHTSVDIKISVNGGGTMGQADAIRMAIARGLVEFTDDPALREKYTQYDRAMLSGDTRRVEPKHFGGRKARARFQKSYR